ncbi:MAG: hypothetical protein V1867_03415 [Candidatus Falkowbacteria bacterium]
MYEFPKIVFDHRLRKQGSGVGVYLDTEEKDARIVSSLKKRLHNNTGIAANIEVIRIEYFISERYSEEILPCMSFKIILKGNKVLSVKADEYSCSIFFYRGSGFVRCDYDHLVVNSGVDRYFKVNSDNPEEVVDGIFFILRNSLKGIGDLAIALAKKYHDLSFSMKN